MQAANKVSSACRGMFPANQLARKHPFILNAKIEPFQWARMAVRGRLPAYKWQDVLSDIKKHTGILSCLSPSDLEEA